MLVLDTDVIIDFLHGHEGTVAFIEECRRREDLATTVLNVAELYRGLGEEPELAGAAEGLEIFLGGVVELPLSHAAAVRGGTILRALDRTGRPVPALDALIAAIALEHGGRMASRNRRHFGRIEGVQLVSPA